MTGPNSQAGLQTFRGGYYPPVSRLASVIEWATLRLDADPIPQPTEAIARSVAGDTGALVVSRAPGEQWVAAAQRLPVNTHAKEAS